MNKNDRLSMMLTNELKEKDYSVKELSDKLEVAESTLVFWINKKTFPTDANLLKVVNYFDTNPLIFFEDNDYTMLEALMWEKGLTIRDLAEKLGEKYRNVETYIRGRKFPKARIGYMICEILEFEPFRWLEMFEGNTVRPPVWLKELKAWKEVRDELGGKWDE